MNEHKPNPEEQPRAKTAEQVIAKKRTYFQPESGVSVEAESQDEALKLFKAKKDKDKQDGK